MDKPTLKSAEIDDLKMRVENYKQYADGVSIQLSQANKEIAALKEEQDHVYSLLRGRTPAQCDLLSLEIASLKAENERLKVLHDSLAEENRRLWLKAQDALVEVMRLQEIEALYEYLKSCIQGVHIEPGARGTGIYTWALQICEPINVQTEGELTGHEIDEAIRAMNDFSTTKKEERRGSEET